VREGHPAVVTLLLRRGARPGVRNLFVSEYSAGNWAARGSADGAPLIPLHQTPLHVAAEQGDAEMVAMLLAAGALCDVPDFDGAAPLHLAVEGGEEEVVAALADAGADLNLPSKAGGRPVPPLPLPPPLLLLPLAPSPRAPHTAAVCLPALAH
jgi:hypothetical protein